MNDVLGSCFDIDPETMRPFHEEIPDTSQIDRQIGRGQDLAAELAGGNGEIIKEVISQFIQRVEVLIADDSECQTYSKLLDTIKIKINLSERLIRKKTKSLF